MRFNTRYFILTTFFIIFLPFFVLAGDMSQFVFTTDSQTIKPNEISEKITIQSQDAEGNSANTTQTACIELATNSGAGEFSASTTNWMSINILTMGKNTSNRNFYYKDSSVGNYVLTAKISLRPDTETRPCVSWPTAEWDVEWTINQNISISNIATAASTSEPISPEPTPDVGSGGSVWPVDPRIYANAGEDKTIVVGVDIEFRGQALGLKKEPIDNARYLWNFGDGSIREGQNVLHSYKYPAEYIVTLDVSSGKYSASDRVIVKVVPNKISISEATSEFIKLKNESDVALDVSGWFLKSGGIAFEIPENTFIKANAEVPVSSFISGIDSVNAGSEISLLYPNGSTAFSYISQKPKIIISQEVQVAQQPQEKPRIEEEEPLLPEPVPIQQNASIVDSIPEDSLGAGKWLFIVLGIGIIAGVGMVIIKR